MDLICNNYQCEFNIKYLTFFKQKYEVIITKKMKKGSLRFCSIMLDI